MAGIDLKFVDAYRKQRSEEEAAAKTIYNETMIVRQLVNFAKSRRLVASDPLAGLRLREPKPTPQPCWTEEEVARRRSRSTSFWLVAARGCGPAPRRPRSAWSFCEGSGDFRTQEATPCPPPCLIKFDALTEVTCVVGTYPLRRISLHAVNGQFFPRTFAPPRPPGSHRSQQRKHRVFPLARDHHLEAVAVDPAVMFGVAPRRLAIHTPGNLPLFLFVLVPRTTSGGNQALVSATWLASTIAPRSLAALAA